MRKGMCGMASKAQAVVELARVPVCSSNVKLVISTTVDDRKSGDFHYFVECKGWEAA